MCSAGWQRVLVHQAAAAGVSAAITGAGIKLLARAAPAAASAARAACVRVRRTYARTRILVIYNIPCGTYLKN